MSNRFYSQSKKNRQWQVDVDEFDSEVENINKKFKLVGILLLINTLVSGYLIFKFY